MNDFVHPAFLTFQSSLKPILAQSKVLASMHDDDDGGVIVAVVVAVVIVVVVVIND